MFQGMEYVYEVYKERSFSKAAANLYISQPSLSANIKRVEERVGCPIFDRSVKPLQLTECGEAYIQAVEKILETRKEFARYRNDWEKVSTGSLILGGSNLFSSWILPPLIGEFSRKYPGIQISLIEDSTIKLADMLQKGRVDLILDNSELDEEGFERRLFCREHLLLAVPGSFEINRKLNQYQLPLDAICSGDFQKEDFLPVPVKEFAGAPFILLKGENDTGKRARVICREGKLQPRVVFEMDQQMTSYNITCSGLGISFVGDVLISRIPPSKDVVYYKLAGQAAARDICFYRKKGRYASRAMEAFLEEATPSL